MKYPTKKAYTPGGDIDLFPFLYISVFQDGVSFNDVTERQKYEITTL